jgi:hypothetical protein
MDAAQLLKEHRRIGRLDDGLLEADRRLAATVLSQPDAEQVYLEAAALARSPWERCRMVRGVGAARGALGVAALREYADASGPGSRDVRGAALAGLADRLGSRSTPDMRRALLHRDQWTRVNAMRQLAHIGDASAWDEAFAVWSGWVSRRTVLWDHPAHSQAVHLLYLLRGVEPGDERAAQLVELVRRHWPVVDHSWFEGHWPEVVPHGPPTPTVPLPDYDSVVQWYLVTYVGASQPPSSDLRFRVAQVHRREPGGTVAIGDVIAGGSDVWQDDVKRHVVIDAHEVTTYVGIESTTIGGAEYSLLSLPYLREQLVEPGSLVSLRDGSARSDG